MRAYQGKTICGRALLALLVAVIAAGGGYGQKQRPVRKPATVQTQETVQTQNDKELSKLHDSYIKATREYKARLERLLALYQASARKTEERVTQSKSLLADGLISQREFEQSEHTLA